MSYLFPGRVYKNWDKLTRLYSRQLNSSERATLSEEEKTTLNIKEIPDNIVYKENIKSSYKLYKTLTRQYLGLGALLQFLWWTNAYKARIRLSNELKPAQDNLFAYIQKAPITYKTHTLTIYRGQYNQLISLSNYSFLHPLFDMLRSIRSYFSLPYSQVNFRHDILYRTINAIPIVHDVFVTPRVMNEKLGKDKSTSSLLKQGLFELIHTFFNPFRMIPPIVFLIYAIIDRLLAIGTPKDIVPVTGFRWLLKELAAFAVGIFLTPIRVIIALVDIPIHIVSYVILSPLMHCIKSFYSAAQHINEELLVTNAKTLKEKVQDFDKIQDLTVIGLDKDQSSPESDNLVAIRAPTETVNAIKGLRFFREPPIFSSLLSSVGEYLPKNIFRV